MGAFSTETVVNIDLNQHGLVRVIGKLGFTIFRIKQILLE